MVEAMSSKKLPIYKKNTNMIDKSAERKIDNTFE